MGPLDTHDCWLPTKTSLDVRKKQNPTFVSPFFFPLLKRTPSTLNAFAKKKAGDVIYSKLPPNFEGTCLISKPCPWKPMLTIYFSWFWSAGRWHCFSEGLLHQQVFCPKGRKQRVVHYVPSRIAPARGKPWKILSQCRRKGGFLKPSWAAFHHTGCFIGNLIMAYYNPKITE